MTTDIGSLHEITDLLPNNDGQQNCFSSAQDSWAVPFPTAGLHAAFPSILSGSGLEQWPAYAVTSAQAPNAFVAPNPVDAPFTSPKALGPRLERLESTAWDGVEPHHSTESSTAAQSSASSSRSTRPSTADHMADLQNGLRRHSQETKQLVQVFFSAIHPHWPILHAPTFNIEDAPYELLGAILVLASWLQDQSDHVDLAPLVFDAVTATLLVRLDLVKSLNYFG